MGKNLTNIFITKANGSRVPIANRRTATDISSAKQNWALNAEDTVSITVVSPFPQTYGIGDKITIFGRDYKLNRLPKVKKTGMHEFQYDLEFEGIQYDLFRVTYDVTIDTTTNELQDVQGDTLTGDLHRFMTVLIANANRVFPGKWVLGVCPETAGDKTLTFGESDNCLSVLQNLCGESNFNVEFEIEQSNGVYTINLYEKVGQTLPYTFQYGRGRGLYELTRENVSSANIVTRLKVYGSTENITSKYRADRLCLPGKTKGQSYIEKAEMVAKYGIFEGRKNFDDIKPSFTGTVESIVSGNVLQFIDSDFPFNLNEKEADGVTTKYLIDGVAAKVHFNTGNLAGYEFEIHSYDHATHTFTLVKQTDDRGNVFPSETSLAFQIGVGDEYKILDIAYPSSIEQAAEEELEETGNKYYDQNCQPKVQYGLSVTKAWLQSLVGSDETVTNVFQPGDYLHIMDNDIDVDKSVRIQSLERNILDPYEYNLTISDTVKTTVTNRVISDLIDIDKVITINNLKDPARARANWRTSRELLNMVFDPDGDYYSDKIKPLSIDTLALSVGAKSMQFGLTNTVFQPNYGGNSNVVKWQGGVLTHYTINEETAVSWVMADGTVTLANNQAYFLYAKCAKNGDAGTFIFSTSQIKVEQDANYYHFLVGTISSIDPELKVRSLSLTYGFSMINGRFIKTGRIESADGTTYFDLDNSEIGGRIVFSSNGQEKTLEELGNEALESKNFINNTLPGLLAEIQAQIDGKIETWFQTTDPAASWTTTALKKKHVGDMWYNSNTRTLKAYREIRLQSTGGLISISYQWRSVENQTAIDAYEAASKAQDTADGKRRVFVSTPYPPYDIGDLWVNGTDLKRCAVKRTSGSYIATDWVKAVSYDNTKTVIDGGLVTSGTIQVAGSTSTILAGMTGQGTAASSVRFWAGTSFENRSYAPYRVMQDGSVVMEKATVKGEAYINKGTINNANLDNVVINGSIANAFRDGYFALGGSAGGEITVSTLGLQNNNNVVITGTSSGWNTAFTIPFTLEYSGFRAIIMNDYFNGQTPVGVIVSNTAPSGKYFYENGRTYRTLSINPYEAVEMIGYGDNSKFYGWIILRRFYTKATNMCGLPFKVSYMGMVNQSGGLIKLHRYDTATITTSRLGTGHYRVRISPGFSSVNNYLVFATCDSTSQGSVGGYASIYAKNTTYFDVYTGDDASANDSGFSFMIVNTTDFTG